MEIALPWMHMREIDAEVDADEALVARVAAGDRHALEQLYARWASPLLAFLLQRVMNRAQAEEILQDTFVAAWQSAGSFEGRSTARSWLYGIARRQAHNHLRRSELDTIDDSVLAEMPSAEPGPEGMLLQRMQREEIARAMARLAPVHREALLLALVQELSYPEMVAALGIPLGTVKSRLSNARRALRALLGESAEGGPDARDELHGRS